MQNEMNEIDHLPAFSGLKQLSVLNRTGVVVSAHNDRAKEVQNAAVKSLLNDHPCLERLATLTNEHGVTDVVLAIREEVECQC